MTTGSPILQSGSVTPLHAASWVTDGVLADAGPFNILPPLASTLIFPTRVTAAAASIGALVQQIQTMGFSSAGDGGGAIYVKTGGTTNGGFQSADGSWWALTALIGTIVTPEMFGAKGDGSTDDTTAISNAMASVTYSTGNVSANGGIVQFSAKTYIISSQLTPGLGVSLLGTYSSDTKNTAPFVSVIAAKSTFAKSTPMIAFVIGWSGRFENLVIDGANNATCGVLYQSGTTHSFNRGIFIRRLGNNASTDYQMRLDSSVSPANIVSNLFININGDAFGTATGTNGLVLAGSTSGQITQNVFHSCDFHCGQNAFSLTTIAGTAGQDLCDNNWFFGCFFGNITGSTGSVVSLNAGSFEFRFFGCAIVNGSSGNCVSATGQSSGQPGSAHIWIGSYFSSSATVYTIGSGGALLFQGCTINDSYFAGISAQTAVSSPFSLTNNTPTVQQVNWFGAGGWTRVQIIRGGSNCDFNVGPGSAFLAPADELLISYTGANPTISTIPWM